MVNRGRCPAVFYYSYEDLPLFKKLNKQKKCNDNLGLFALKIKHLAIC